MQNHFVKKQGTLFYSMHQKSIITILPENFKSNFKICDIMFFAENKRLILFPYHKNCIKYSIFNKLLKLFKVSNSKWHLNAQQQWAFECPTAMGI
jgi:hypothetical protein